MHVNLHFLDYVWANVGTYCLFKVRVTFLSRASVLCCTERRWGMGGNGKMSREVNTETGVWQGTMIRFINQPMLFSLRGDCCKTFSANGCSQRPTTEVLIPPSPSLLSQILLFCTPLHPSLPLLSITASLSSYPMGAIRFSPSCPTKMDWPWKHPFCFHHHPCAISSLVRGVSSFPPCLPRPLAGTYHPIFSPAEVELNTLGMGLLRWSSCSQKGPGTIFLHLRASVLLPILWIFYQLLNHSSMIGKVIGRAAWYENCSINFVSVRAHSLGY